MSHAQTPLSLSLSKAPRKRHGTMIFHAYLLRCNDGSFYAGHTDNLEQRMAQHATGVLGGYTASRRPVVMVRCQDFSTRDEAFAAEHQIKGWSRAKKQALIVGDWARISQLAKSRLSSGMGTELAAGPSTGSG